MTDDMYVSCLSSRLDKVIARAGKVMKDAFSISYSSFQKVPSVMLACLIFIQLQTEAFADNL